MVPTHVDAMHLLDPDFSSRDYVLDGIAFEHSADRDHLAEGIDLALNFHARG